MARRNKPSKSRKSAQEQKQINKELRAEWRKLEKLGVVKKRAKGEKLKLTEYKKRRIKQLRPIIEGKAAAVPLGPKALKQARNNGIPIIGGRYAVVPKTRASIEAVKSGRSTARTYESVSSRTDYTQRAVDNVIRLSEGGKRPANGANIEKRISLLSNKARAAVARANSYDDWVDWLDDSDEEYDFDPFWYH